MYEDIINTDDSKGEYYTLTDVGEERFFQGCSNCGNRFGCEPEFALNECGDKYEKWTKSNK